MSNTFSILNRIDIPATDDARAWRMDRIRTFSILNRIDIPATHCPRPLHPHSHIAFSILNRIDIPATFAGGWFHLEDTDFQYPQPDRYPCNPHYRHTWNRRFYDLSVSSTGSISLQLLSCAMIALPREAFSILNRIDIPATKIYRWRLSCLGSSFSILNRIDIPATLPAAFQTFTLALSFQYPQPDRYPCNRISVDRQPEHTGPFSILNRIDIPATRVISWRHRLRF